MGIRDFKNKLTDTCEQLKADVAKLSGDKVGSIEDTQRIEGAVRPYASTSAENRSLHQNHVIGLSRMALEGAVVVRRDQVYDIRDEAILRTQEHQIVPRSQEAY